MSGRSILEKAIALMHESDMSLYDAYALPWMNIILAETYDINERIRESKGLVPQKRELYTAPSLETELLVEPEMENALVYGMLVKVYSEEENTALLNTYMQLYEIEKRNADRGKAVFNSLGYGW